MCDLQQHSYVLLLVGGSVLTAQIEFVLLMLAIAQKVGYCESGENSRRINVEKAVLLSERIVVRGIDHFLFQSVHRNEEPAECWE